MCYALVHSMAVQALVHQVSTFVLKFDTSRTLTQARRLYPIAPKSVSAWSRHSNSSSCHHPSQSNVINFHPEPAPPIVPTKLFRSKSPAFIVIVYVSHKCKINQMHQSVIGQTIFAKKMQRTIKHWNSAVDLKSIMLNTDNLSSGCWCSMLVRGINSAWMRIGITLSFQLFKLMICSNSSQNLG